MLLWEWLIIQNSECDNVPHLSYKDAVHVFSTYENNQTFFSKKNILEK